MRIVSGRIRALGSTAPRGCREGLAGLHRKGRALRRPCREVQVVAVRSGRAHAGQMDTQGDRRRIVAGTDTGGASRTDHAQLGGRGGQRRVRYDRLRQGSRMGLSVGTVFRRMGRILAVRQSRDQVAHGLLQRARRRRSRASRLSRAQADGVSARPAVLQLAHRTGDSGAQPFRVLLQRMGRRACLFLPDGVRFALLEGVFGRRVAGGEVGRFHRRRRAR